MNNFDLIKKKARKLKALADGGIKGEQENAKAFLDEFMKKHNLKEEDISDDAFTRLFKQKGLEHNTIVTHAIISVNPYCKLGEEKGNYKVILDDVDFNEVEYKTKFFYDLFLEEMDRLFYEFEDSGRKGKSEASEKELFFTAFMTKHRECFQPDKEAFLKHKPNTKPMSKKEAEAMKKAQMEAEKEFRKRQEEELKKKKKEDKDKSKEPPTPIDYGDMERMQRIILKMKNANYTKVRNTLPIYIKKLEHGGQKKEKKRKRGRWF